MARRDEHHMALLGKRVLLLAVICASAVLAWKGLVSAGRASPASTLAAVGIIACALFALTLWRIDRAPHARSSTKRASSNIGLIMTACGVFAVGLCLTTMAVWDRSERIAESARIDFESRADRLTGRVTRKMQSIVSVLRSVRGLYASSQDVNRAEFAAFVESCELSHELKGISGLGFIERIKREDIDSFVTVRRADGAPEYAVRSTSDAGDLLVIKYLCDLENSFPTLGYDIGSNPLLRAVAERSMLTGEATLSGKVTFGTGVDVSNGLLYLLPIYRQGARLVSHSDRSDALLGWAFFPLIAEEVLLPVAQSSDGYLDLEVFEGTELSKATLLYDFDGDLLDHKSDWDNTRFQSRLLGQTSYIKVGGGQWTVRCATTPKFESSIDRATPVLFGAGGASLSLLLAILIWSQGRSRARAIALLEAKSEHRFNSLVDASPALIWTSGLDTKCTHFNRGWLEFTGRALEDELGDGWAQGVHPEDLGRVLSVYSAAVASRTEFVIEYRLRHSSGQYRWIFDKGSPHIDALGVFHGYVGMAIDVTERRMAEEANQRFSDMLQRTGAMAHVGGWEVDLLDNQLTWSDEVYRIHEVEKGSPIDVKNAIDFYAPHVRSVMAELLRNATEHGTPWDLELPFITAKGKELWVRVQGEAEMLSGRAVKLRGTFQDITDRKRNEVALIEARAAAEAANKSKSEFLANMSHEIRTPLTAILGYSDMLREDGALENAPERRVQTIDTIQNAGNHLMAILNDILDLSKIEAGKMNVEEIETPIVKIMAEIESMVRPRAKAKGIALSLQLGTPVPSLILSDPTRLRQILLNLVGNAVKFTESGRVTVLARIDRVAGASQVVIDVEDTGPGLTAEHAAQLFSPFTQADATVTRRHGGTGLGLTICRRLAELMGGSVVIAKTEPGVGSCFRLSIPLVRVSGAVEIRTLDVVHTAPATIMPGEVRLNGRILLAEDGPDNQRLISFHLIKAGAIVEIAENGRVALRCIEEAEQAGQPYDLLLTDMQMPEMDGYSLTRTLRARGNTMPIVALTAHSMAEDRKRCTDAGCDDYASKPIEKASLLRTCFTWMNKSNVQRRAAA